VRLFNADIKNAVLLKWEVTPEEKADGLFGLRELIDQVCEKRIKFNELDIPPDFMVLGDPYHMEWSDAHEKQLRYHMTWSKNALTDRVLRLFLYHLFREGHISDGFYILKFERPIVHR
jgi:hypothetical protein